MGKKKQSQDVEVKVVEQETPAPKLNVINIEKNDDVQSLNDKVDEQRKSLLKSYKKTNLINNILLVIVAAIFIGSFVLITRGTWGQIAGWVMIGVTLTGLVIYFLLTRKKYPNLSRQYFKVFWEATNNYLFSDSRFEECSIDIDERYELSDVISQRVYKDVVSTASRNIVRGKFSGKEFVFGELGVYKAGAKRNARDVVFVGRHLSLDSNLEFEGRYIINIRKKEEPVDLPTDIEDLKPLLEDGLLTIYGEEGANYEKDLGKKFISELQSLVCNAPLLNINFVLWNKKTFCYLSYDDSIVAIPFEKAIDTNAYVTLKRNIEDVFELLTK